MHAGIFTICIFDMNHNCNPYNLSFMTQIAVQEQIDAMKKTAEKALRSKETALRFLVEAGIVKEKQVNEPKRKK